MKYSLDKYKFYQHDNEVIAVSTFAGKKVRGVAKCDPNDKFNFEDGKKLAAARCNQKIAMKRLKRANQKYREVAQLVIEAQRELEKVRLYYMDAVDACDEATEELVEIIKHL